MAMSMRESQNAVSPAPGELSGAPRVRRPESVLIVIYTAGGEFLLIERIKPAGYWQSVTGSLEWGELPDQAARRELLEETGITEGVLKNLQWTQVYEISPEFGQVLAGHSFPSSTARFWQAGELALAAAFLFLFTERGSAAGKHSLPRCGRAGLHP